MDLVQPILAADIADAIARDFMPVLAVGGGLVVAIVAIVATQIRAAMKTSQVERTRREIAAYVAEGSISPEDGHRMMAASGKESGCST